MTKQTNRPGRRENGQYSHGFDVMCVCGAPKGSHDAVAPFPLDDEMRPGYVRECERFKKAKVAK